MNMKSKSDTLRSSDVQILPLEPKDQWKPIDDIRTLVFFIIRQPLDEDVLRTSLDSLIRNHLRILGARIRPSEKSGPLLYHLPATFSADDVLFEWSSRSVPATLEGSQILPCAGGQVGPAIKWGKSIPDLENEWIPAGWPRARHEDTPDTPTLLVHLTHYRDGTVLSINLPHAVVDQLGYASFIRAWLQVAGGNKPPEFLQLEPGALDGSRDIPEKKLRQKGLHRVKTLRDRIGITLGFIPELATQPDEIRRLLVFPESVIANLREKHQATITSEHGPDHPKLTNGDILAALLLKLGHLHRKKPKMVLMSAVANARGRHPVLMGDKPYLHNAITYSAARIPVSRSTPVCEIARQNRLSVIEAVKPQSVDRSFAVTRETFRRGYGIHICEPGEYSFSVTNWSSAWHGIDFSVAFAKDASAERGPLPQAPPLVLGHSLPRLKRMFTRCECAWFPAE